MWKTASTQALVPVRTGRAWLAWLTRCSARCTPSAAASAPALPASAVRDVYLLGGSCRLTSHVTIGPVAFPGTEGISADAAVIGVGGVSAKAGFTTTNLQEAQMMAQMIESAQRTIVVMHSSKFGRSAFAHIVRLDAIELLITDQMPEPELRDALTAAEVEIVVAAG